MFRRLFQAVPRTLGTLGFPPFYCVCVHVFSFLRDGWLWCHKVPGCQHASVPMFSSYCSVNGSVIGSNLNSTENGRHTGYSTVSRQYTVYSLQQYTAKQHTAQAQEVDELQFRDYRSRPDQTSFDWGSLADHSIILDCTGPVTSNSQMWQAVSSNDLWDGHPGFQDNLDRILDLQKRLHKRGGVVWGQSQQDWGQTVGEAGEADVRGNITAIRSCHFWQWQNPGGHAIKCWHRSQFNGLFKSSSCGTSPQKGRRQEHALTQSVCKFHIQTFLVLVISKAFPTQPFPAMWSTASVWSQQSRAVSKRSKRILRLLYFAVKCGVSLCVLLHGKENIYKKPSITLNYLSKEV